MVDEAEMGLLVGLLSATGGMSLNMYVLVPGW